MKGLGGTTLATTPAMRKFGDCTRGLNAGPHAENAGKHAENRWGGQIDISHARAIDRGWKRVLGRFRGIRMSRRRFRDGSACFSACVLDVVRGRKRLKIWGPGNKSSQFSTQNGTYPRLKFQFPNLSTVRGFPYFGTSSIVTNRRGIRHTRLLRIRFHPPGIEKWRMVVVSGIPFSYHIRLGTTQHLCSRNTKLKRIKRGSCPSTSSTPKENSDRSKEHVFPRVEKVAHLKKTPSVFRKCQLNKVGEFV